MKFGIHYIYWQKDISTASYLPCVYRARKAGFDVLELGDHIIFHMTDRELDEVAAAARGEGIELMIGIDPPQDKSLTAADAARRDAGVQFYAEAMPKLRRLGIQKLGGHFLNAAPIPPHAAHREAEWSYSVQSMQRIADIAAQYGITVCVEAVNRFEGHIVNTAKQGCRFVDDVQRDNLMLELDSFHMNIEESSLINGILTAGKRLGHFHFVENHRGLPGTGHIQWAEVRDALHHIGYDGILSMEALVRCDGELGDAARIWRDLTDGADEDGLDEQAAASLSAMRALFRNGSR